MINERAGDGAPNRPLRLWPGVFLVALQWALWLAIPAAFPQAAGRGLVWSLGCGLGVILWWLLLSRAPWIDRLLAVALVAAGLAATPLILHPSVRTAGMGMLFYINALPVACLALVLWAAAAGRLPAGPRRATMAAALVAAFAGWGLVRTEGITGSVSSQLAWRWAATPEEWLLAGAATEPRSAAPPARPAPREAEWPGFRGPRRDGVVPGVRIATDWSTSPPRELWRRPVGPGWSSVAVAGGRLYTQEQRGEEEVVACYDAITGAPLWRHGYRARFWESNGGAGPRATPAVDRGRVYALGATGVLTALDAADGAVAWSRDAAADSAAELPDWGFSGSPLVTGGAVVVATGGALAGYDPATGEPLWIVPGKGGYSSPHPLLVDGVEQVVLLNGAGATAYTPADGARLWAHAWPGFPIVQPARVDGAGLLIESGGDRGLRRLALSSDGAGWSVEEGWTTIRLKPYFNDFVVHRGHAYGFDGAILTAIDLADGARAWKGGRYGHGQLLLLPDQDLLLVLSERGDLALVSAAPDGYRELATAPALEGKTWNHPVVVGDLLVVRNDREMAAFRLPPAGG